MYTFRRFSGDMMDDFRGLSFPKADMSRLPFAAYRDPALYDEEQRRIFQGPTWSYVALGAEIPNPNDFRTSVVGDVPVIVSRAADGTVHVVVNRCAHRGAIVRREMSGNAESHICCYHQWCYDPAGNLTGVPFMRGVKGKGGLPRDFDKAEHGLRKLRVGEIAGAIFASFDDEAEPLEAYLDMPIVDHLNRLLHKPPMILGYQRQRIFGNWKLYTDNLRDPNHGGLLHMFQITFGIARLSQWGGAKMDRKHRHNISFTAQGTDADDGAKSYGDTARGDSAPRLEAPALLVYRPEFPDRLSLSIASVFPNAVFQQIGNSLAIRQIRPKSVDEFEIFSTYFGFADDDAEMTAHRLRQANLSGPAGFVSMEDGEAVELVHRAIRREADTHSVVEYGGRGPIVDQDNLVTEVPMRGFWANSCELMGLPVAQEPADAA
jgi:anthranilate 1,2-dioxygenase large subunit